jgi:hypothetical protein
VYGLSQAAAMAWPFLIRASVLHDASSMHFSQRFALVLRPPILGEIKPEDPCDGNATR